MSIRDDKIWKCFVCNESGNAISFVQKYENKVLGNRNFTVRDAMNKVIDICHLNIPKEQNNQNSLNAQYSHNSRIYSEHERVLLNTLNKIKEIANYNLISLGNTEAKQYLLNRGFTEDLIQELQFGYISYEQIQQWIDKTFLPLEHPVSYTHLIGKKCKEWIYDKTIEKHEKGIPMYKFSFQEKMTLLELTKDRHMIELLAVDHNEVIKNKATDKLKKIDEATKKVSPVHELLKQKETVPHKIYFTDYQTTVRLELIKDSICYYKNELNNSIYALERKDAHLPQVMQRMLEPYLKANEKNTNVYVLTDSDLANSNYHSLLIEYQNYPERFDYVRKGIVTSSQKTAIMENENQFNKTDEFDEIEK